MICIVFIILIACIYLKIAWEIYKKKNKFNNVPYDLEVINLGSTYAFYGFDYSVDGKKRAFNLAQVPQYLYYDRVNLLHCLSHLREGAYVIIVLPNFVFCVDGKLQGSKKDEYYMYLKSNEIAGFDFRKKWSVMVKAFKEPFTHEEKKRSEKWKGYVASFEEKEKHAISRIKDWEKNIGISLDGKSEISEQIRKNIRENIEIVDNMIDICLDNNLVPVLLTMPESPIMKGKIPVEYLEKCLYEPIQYIIKKKNTQYYNLSYIKELDSERYYMNSDCFNEEGRKKFTEIVLRKIDEDKTIYEENISLES